LQACVSPDEAHLLCGQGIAKMGFGLFAVFYLAWVIQAVLLQVPYDYTLTPQVFLAICLLIAWGRAFFKTVLGTILISVFIVFAVAPHPLRSLDRLALWPDCWREGSSARIRDGLKLEPDVDWQELERVGDYLRTLGLHDGELTCYNNSTLSLYLDLGLKPSTRFLHFDTLLRSMPGHRETIRRELADSRQRYVVSDLRAAGLSAEQQEESLRSNAPLARWLPEGQLDQFPWTEPVA